MHAFIPTTYASLIFVYSFLFSLSFLVLPLFLYVPSVLLYYSQLPFFILSAMVGFTIFTSQLLLPSYECPFKIVH